MRYKCSCTYNGTYYSGSQRQKNAKTVQGEIERALVKVYNQTITIHPASRTDKGVHAIEQVFHYDSSVDIDTAKLASVINRQLPDDIRITKAEVASDSFHARYDVTAKTYHYILSTDDHYNVFNKDICYQYNQPFNIEKATALSAHFLGEHDFKAFMAAGSDKLNTIRTIYDIIFEQTDNQVTMQMSGDGFLYHMVRIMMGLFLDYAEGNKTETEILKQFAAGNRHYFKRTAPACGLYLANIRYG